MLPSPLDELQTFEAISRKRYVLVRTIPRESSGYVSKDKTTVQKTYSAFHCESGLGPMTLSTEKKLTLVHLQVPRNPTLQQLWVNHCYFHQDLLIDKLWLASAKLSSQHRLPTYSTPLISHETGIPYNEECNPFLRLEISEGELLHTPERVSTSMTTVLLFRITNTISFHNPKRGCGLCGLEVHSSSPDLLTKRGPLRELCWIIFQCQR